MTHNSARKLSADQTGQVLTFHDKVTVDHGGEDADDDGT
jgi:hypothetical protein